MKTALSLIFAAGLLVSFNSAQAFNDASLLPNVNSSNNYKPSDRNIKNDIRNYVKRVDDLLIQIYRADERIPDRPTAGNYLLAPEAKLPTGKRLELERILDAIDDFLASDIPAKQTPYYNSHLTPVQ